MPVSAKRLKLLPNRVSQLFRGGAEVLLAKEDTTNVTRCVWHACVK